MKTRDELMVKAIKMQEFIETEIPTEPNDLIDRLNLLSVLIAQSSQMLADAKFYQDKLINGAIMESLKQEYNGKLSPSTINQYVKTEAKDANYLVNWIDRINATATHQIDAVRSIISYRKSEMNLI